MAHSPGYLALVDEARTRVPETTVEDVSRQLEGKSDFVLIDTREEHEWENGHIPRATFLSKGIIEREIERAVPEKSTEIVLYCAGGYRSVLAGDNLRKMGYTNVSSMAGGWKAWKAAGGSIAGGNGSSR